MRVSARCHCFPPGAAGQTKGLPNRLIDNSHEGSDVDAPKKSQRRRRKIVLGDCPRDHAAACVITISQVRTAMGTTGDRPPSAT